jgi:adenylate kinase family enzyme
VRINVIGTSGSGKTTFGRQLAEVLDLPFLEMDALFWGPDWSFPEDPELFARLSAALEGEDWVLDGNYTRTREIKWARVDAVVWLDYSFPRTLFQAVSRALSRAFSGEELWPGTGNRETFQKLFSRDSIVLWTIRTYGKNRRRIPRWMNSEEHREITFHRLRSPREAESFLERLKENPGLIRDAGWKEERP